MFRFFALMRLCYDPDRGGQCCELLPVEGSVGCRLFPFLDDMPFARHFPPSIQHNPYHH